RAAPTGHSACSPAGCTKGAGGADTQFDRVGLRSRRRPGVALFHVHRGAFLFLRAPPFKASAPALAAWPSRRAAAACMPLPPDGSGGILDATSRRLAAGQRAGGPPL